MKIYILTDMEGAAGVVAFDKNLDNNEPQYLWRRERHSRLLMGEVNAAVDACFEAGANEVVVDDSHGGGILLNFEDIDSRAKLIQGRSRPGMLAGLDSSFDAVVFIGAHAMIGAHRAVLSHTMSSMNTRQIRINGKPIGEIGIFALYSGSFDVPMVFLSGDTAACSEAKKIIKNITAVEVKEGYSRNSAVSLSPAMAQEAIKNGIKAALKDIGRVKPLKLKGPCTFQTDSWPEGLKNYEQYASHPDNLPKSWVKGPLVKAGTIFSLLRKVYGKKV